MKVYPFKIPKKPNENIILQIDKGIAFYDKLHQHEEIQLSYIVSGKGKLVVGNSVNTFNPGDFIALGSNVPHLFLSQIDGISAHMISIFFTRTSFGKHFFDNQEMKRIRPLFRQLSFGFKVEEKDAITIDLIFGLRNENKFQLFIGLLKLLQHLTQVPTVPLIDNPYTFKINTNQGQRLQVVFDYVMQNFNTEIKLEQVAEKVHMSKNAFCRFFKQHTNKTFFQFLAEIRVQHACELLKERQESTILEIASQSGYNTISNFNRQFKEIKGINPRNYRNALLNPV